jgi:hypothetical protein
MGQQGGSAKLSVAGGPPPELEPSAAQVCNMLCEMYGARGGGVGAAVLAQCFGDELRVSNLSSGSVRCGTSSHRLLDASWGHTYHFATGMPT